MNSSSLSPVPQGLWRLVLLAVLNMPMAGALAGTLFESDQPLSIALMADFTAIEAERDKSKAYPGTLTMADIALPIELNVRGNFRLQKKTCKYPPLKVDFKKSEQKADTPFHKEGDLKLVVQCRDTSSYRDYLRTEYLTYKLLNQITPLSYRVRWVEISYSDPAGGAIGVREGFFVERKKNVAARNGLEVVEGVPRISLTQMDAGHASLLEHFQFLIGNTDYSLARSSDADDCCHNAKLLRRGDQYVPIIYDFDSSGLVKTPYAGVAGNLPIKRVTTRLFRGFCYDAQHLQAARAALTTDQVAKLELLSSDTELGDRQKKRALKFLEAGLNTLADDKRYQRLIVGKCRSVPGSG